MDNTGKRDRLDELRPKVERAISDMRQALERYALRQDAHQPTVDKRDAQLAALVEYINLATEIIEQTTNPRSLVLGVATAMSARPGRPGEAYQAGKHDAIQAAGFAVQELFTNAYLYAAALPENNPGSRAAGPLIDLAIFQAERMLKTIKAPHGQPTH